MDQSQNFLITDEQLGSLFTTLFSEPLGAGRNAVVYLTQHLKTGMHYALKTANQD